jgi:hypothetical protein
MAQVQVDVQRGSPFQIGLLGLSLVELEDRAVVDSYDSALGEYDPMTAGSEGHIQSNGDITLLTDNTVNGNVLAGGAVTLGSGSTITGTATEGVPSVAVVTDVSVPPPTSDTAGISPPGAYDTSTYDLTVNPGQTVTLEPGTYSFNKITLRTGAKLAMAGPVVIYMADQFYAQNGAVINTSKSPANLMIISSVSGADAITTEEPGSGEFYGGIYALNGEVEFNDGGWNIYGAIVADEIDIEDDARFHPAGKFRPSAGTWQELFQ